MISGGVDDYTPLFLFLCIKGENNIAEDCPHVGDPAHGSAALH